MVVDPTEYIETLALGLDAEREQAHQENAARIARERQAARNAAINANRTKVWVGWNPKTGLIQEAMLHRDDHAWIGKIVQAKSEWIDDDLKAIWVYADTDDDRIKCAIGANVSYFQPVR